MVLAQLGLDEREVEERVRLFLGCERAELGGLAGERLAVLVDPQEAFLGQAPAAVAGALTQPDVVLLRAGEVDPVRACLAGRHHHQVHLGAAHQPDGGLVRATIEDRIHEAEPGERVDERRRLVGLGKEIEIADRFPPAAIRARGFDAPDAWRRSERFDQPVGQLLGPVKQHPIEPVIELGDPLEDERLGPGGHPALLAKTA